MMHGEAPTVLRRNSSSWLGKEMQLNWPGERDRTKGRVWCREVDQEKMYSSNTKSIPLSNTVYSSKQLHTVNRGCTMMHYLIAISNDTVHHCSMIAGGKEIFRHCTTNIFPWAVSSWYVAKQKMEITSIVEGIRHNPLRCWVTLVQLYNNRRKAKEWPTLFSYSR